MLTSVTLILFLSLIIWGGKLPQKGEDGKRHLHDDSMSLEATKGLRGIAAIGVILHHIAQESAFQQANGWGKPGELFLFVNAGFLFVAIFFFCSGFGLIKSLNSKPDYFNGFLKKRVVKTLVIPFYVSVIIYAIFRVACGEKLELANWICNFIGITMMNEYAWFPIVIAILYLAFYFIFKNIKNRKLAFFLMFLVIFAQGVIFCFNGHFPWWLGPKNWWLNNSIEPKWWMKPKIFCFSGEWWVNSCVAFLIGMIFAQKEEAIRGWFKKLYALKLIGIVILNIGAIVLSILCQMNYGYWSEWDGKGPGILNKFICYCAQLPEVTIFVILVFVFMMMFYSVNPITRFFANISFETYMVNLIPLTAFRFLLYKSVTGQFYPVNIVKPYHYNLAIYEVLVIVTTILLGLGYKWLNKQANKLVK